MKTILLSAIIASAHAAIGVDGDWYDISDSNHHEHAIGGAILGAGLYAGASPVSDDRSTRYLVAIGGTAVAAVAYEVIREQRGEAQFIDVADVGWTILGGAVGAVLADYTGRAFTAMASPDRVGIAARWEF